MSSLIKSYTRGSESIELHSDGFAYHRFNGFILESFTVPDNHSVSTMAYIYKDFFSIANALSRVGMLLDYPSCPALPEQGGAPSYDVLKNKNLDLFDDDLPPIYGESHA